MGGGCERTLRYAEGTVNDFPGTPMGPFITPPDQHPTLTMPGLRIRSSTSLPHCR
jgi:hypothetical protein